MVTGSEHQAVVVLAAKAQITELPTGAGRSQCELRPQVLAAISWREAPIPMAISDAAAATAAPVNGVVVDRACRAIVLHISRSQQTWVVSATTASTVAATSAIAKAARSPSDVFRAGNGLQLCEVRGQLLGEYVTFTAREVPSYSCCGRE